MKKIMTVFISIAILTATLSGCGVSSVPDTSAAVEPDTGLLEGSAGAEASSSIAEQEAPPPFSWEVDAPENHGMDGALLAYMHTALESTEIYSMVTVKDGVIVDEYYKEGYDETSVFPVHSVSKSFTGALVGIAMDEGLIDSLDTPISEYFPQINDADSGYLGDVTTRHLLTHTSGIEWYEWNGRVDTFFEWRESDNWVDYVLNRPFAAQPGATFNYTTGGTHLLAAIVARVSGQSVTDFATEHLFGPMDMDSVQWGEDPQGIADGGNGLLMSARDMAKFGQLFLQNGDWNGQQLISQSWVAESTSVQFVRGTNSGDYGYQWWVRPFGGYDTYFAMGAWGQFIFVVPELNLVTTVTSNHPEDTYHPWPFFTDYVLASCQG